MPIPTAIADSNDLAVILNATPGTPQDAAETPRDWLAGIWVAGTVYPLDAQTTTTTRAVLADGTAAVEFSPRGTRCRHGEHRTGIEYTAAHWCAADVDTWTAEGDARGARRDWRSVYVWDANGFAETTVYPTVDEARAEFAGEVADLQRITDQMAEDTVLDDEDAEF